MSRQGPDITSEELLEEAIPLIAQDLRSARRDLGLTSAGAAKRAGIGLSRYRDLEAGRVPRNRENVRDLVEVARSLGLESVRTCYADAVGQYVRAGVARGEPLTLFIDALDSPVADLKAHGHFVGPHLVLEFLEREGLTPVIDSRQRTDKMLVELWVTALYALCLGREYEYYVRPMRDDPPDTEVLTVDSRTNRMQPREVEVAQFGRHSAELTDVIGKKLRNRYAEGTVLLVLVERAHALDLAELYHFVRRHNRHGQEMAIVGATQEAGEFKVIPVADVATPAPGDWTWSEVTADTRESSRARWRYDGVVFEPPPRFRPQAPVFVKSVALHR